jgi:hypothetical protein
MTNVIYKYPLQIERKFRIELPLGAKILSVQLQDDKPMLWAQINPEAMTEYRHFRVLMTGEKHVERDDQIYLATLQHNGIVVHIFEDRFYHNKR